MEHGGSSLPMDGMSSRGSSDLQSRRGQTMEGFHLKPEKVKFKQVQMTPDMELSDEVMFNSRDLAKVDAIELMPKPKKPA